MFALGLFLVLFVNIYSSNGLEENIVHLNLLNSGKGYQSLFERNVEDFLNENNIGPERVEKPVHVVFDILPPNVSSIVVARQLERKFRELVTTQAPTAHALGNVKVFKRRIVFDVNFSEADNEDGNEVTLTRVDDDDDVTPTPLDTLINYETEVLPVIKFKPLLKRNNRRNAWRTFTSTAEPTSFNKVDVEISRPALIKIDRKDHAEIKEEILKNVFKTLSLKKLVSYSAPREFDFSFQTYKSIMSPKTIKNTAEKLYQDLRELEPNAIIYPAEYDFGHDNHIVITIKMKIPSLKRSGIYAILSRFPLVKNGMVTVDITKDLGQLPDKLEQIIGYKLSVTPQVRDGEKVKLVLPFKVRREDRMKTERTAKALIVDLLKKFDGVDYVSYNLKKANNTWILMNLVVKMPYSNKTAVFDGPKVIGSNNRFELTSFNLNDFIA